MQNKNFECYLEEYTEAKQSFNPNALDIPALQKYSPEVRSELLAEFWEEILAGVVERIKTPSDPPAISVDTKTALYCKEAPWCEDAQWQAMLTAYNGGLDPWLRNVPLEFFLYTAYCKRGRGLHELLCGQVMPVKVSQLEGAFLEKIGQLPIPAQNLIIGELESSRKQETRWGLYTYQERISELTAERNYNDSYFVRTSIPVKKETLKRIKMDSAFARSTIVNKVHPLHGITEKVAKPIAQWHKLFFLIWRLCAEHNISADRLFCPDFSCFAVNESGDPLTELQQKQLCLFLQLPRETRMKTLAKLCAFTEQ